MFFFNAYKTMFFAAACFLALPVSYAQAQGAPEGIIAPPVDVLPAITQQPQDAAAFDTATHTHPALKLTPDKSELVRLDEPAASIIVGNPNHLNVLADTSQTLVLVPRAPGATHFTILNQSGQVIMQRHVIIGAGNVKEKYLRVRRSCAGLEADECTQTSVFYCPDMCHEIIIDSGGDDSSEQGLDELISEAVQSAVTPESGSDDGESE